MQKFDIEVLEAKIGYIFSDRSFLTEALTHSSYANELKAKKQTVQCNERLEFLGDSVLSVVVSEYLFDRFADLPEGELYKTEELTVQISSERLDAVIARVFSLSREDAQSLFSKRLVFASGREIESTSYSPKEGEKISVRGYGRFIYRGVKNLSKKGKLFDATLKLDGERVAFEFDNEPK